MNRTELRRMLKSQRGIAVILAALLMVVIVIIAGVLVYAWATGLFGSLMGTAPSVREGLSMDAYSVSGTTITLNLRNVGSVNTALASYIVLQGTTQVCTGTLTNTIAVQAVVAVSLTGCTTTSGIAYTAKLITSKGNQFTYQIVP